MKNNYIPQAYCQTGGPNSRTEQSLGRKRRDVDDQSYSMNETGDLAMLTDEATNSTDEEEHVREVIEASFLHDIWS